MIRFENIEVTFGDFTAIPSLDLQVEPGEFFTLLGPSGCGKTTLARTELRRKLRVYADANHPHVAQQPQPLSFPKSEAK